LAKRPVFGIAIKSIKCCDCRHFMAFSLHDGNWRCLNMDCPNALAKWRSQTLMDLQYSPLVNFTSFAIVWGFRIALVGIVIWRISR
jgi:hypothetical protein